MLLWCSVAHLWKKYGVWKSGFCVSVGSQSAGRRIVNQSGCDKSSLKNGRERVKPKAVAASRPTKQAPTRLMGYR
jgi:hypothetical protein